MSQAPVVVVGCVLVVVVDSGGEGVGVRVVAAVLSSVVVVKVSGGGKGESGHGSSDGHRWWSRS